MTSHTAQYQTHDIFIVANIVLRFPIRQNAACPVTWGSVNPSMLQRACSIVPHGPYPILFESGGASRYKPTGLPPFPYCAATLLPSISSFGSA